MLIEEDKILLANLKNTHNIVVEGVSDDTIAKAIHKREYIYIYYEGDNTIKKGYRTIRPFVLGKRIKKNGGNLNKVVRAWQDKGTSDSFNWPNRRENHEYHTDTDGKTKVGWRLFRLDKITSVYPTGRRFIDENGKVMIPPLYHQADKDLVDISASIDPNTKSVYSKDNDSIEKPNVRGIKTDMDKSDFKVQTGRFKQFYNVGRHKRDATSDEIEHLYNITKKVMKKSPNDYFVAINNKGDLKLVNVKNLEKFPPDAIIGDLPQLYSKFVLSKKTQPDLNKTFDKHLDDIKNKSKKEPNREIDDDISY